MSAAGGTTVDWILSQTCIIFMESGDTGSQVRPALWMESHLPWFTEVEDEYTMDTVGGVAVAAGTTKPKIKRYKIFSGIQNNTWIKYDKVVLVACEKGLVNLSFGGQTYPVENDPAGGYTTHNLRGVRRANVGFLMGSGRDLVEVFDESLRHHKRGELPWNRVYALLCSLAVHFRNPASGKTVNALQGRISATNRAALGTWNNAAEISVMGGLCLVEHLGSRWMSPSEHDIKMGALRLLRSVESILDIGDMEDDLYIFSSMVASLRCWQIRLASIIDFVEAQECGVIVGGNEGIGANILPTYRWTPPHSYRFPDLSAGSLPLPGFKQDLTHGVWYSNRYVCLEKHSTTTLGLNLLRLRVNEGFELKDLISTHNLAQIARNPTTTWDYTNFLSVFLGDTRPGAARLEISPLLRIRDFRTKSVLVGVMTPNTKAIFAGVGRLDARFDVAIFDDTFADTR